MTLHHYTVTELRSAATCPRIHYFDLIQARRAGLDKPRSTRVWLPGLKAQAGGGAAFHSVVERFNRQAASDGRVLEAITNSQGDIELQQALLRYVNENCIHLDALAARSVPLRQAFIKTLQDYFGELAAIINYAVSNDIEPSDVVRQLFGDPRRRVDVTFHVGDDDQAHVTGAIDYVFYDWRLPGHRIVDYKLMPHSHANRDLYQVYAYALMHHHQHQTEPGVSVFYLHPQRHIVERTWDQVRAERHKVYQMLASMVAWGRFDEETQKGLKPPGDVTWCAACKWNKNGQCEARLGAKSEGEWDKRWDELPSLRERREPLVEVQEPSPANDAAEEALDLAELDSDDDRAQPGPDPSRTDQAKLVSANVVVDTHDPTREDQPGPFPLGGQLFLGHAVQDNAPISLDPSTITTHIALVGAAGSGKTWTAKVIAEEVVAAGVPVVAIDPQGDLVQLMLGRDASSFTETERQRWQAYQRRADVRIFTPGTSHGIRLSLNPIRLPTNEDLARIDKPERRDEEEQGMLQAVANNLVSLAKIGGEEDAQRTFLYTLLSAMNRQATIELRDVVGAILAPESLGIDDPDFIVRKTERAKLARKLNTFVIGPAKSLFSGGLPLDIDEMCRPTSHGKVPLNIIYLNALTDDDQKHFFLATLASELYRWMMSSLDATTGKPNLLFYIDEARDWIPAGSKNPPAKQPLIRLFTQGRKYGVGCLLCTQSPRSVDYNVFGNCSTKIIGRMEASQDIDRIAEWFTITGAAPRWIAERKGAPKGTFVARWPGMPPQLDGQAFKGRILYSAHEGAWSPDRVEREVDAVGMRPGSSYPNGPTTGLRRQF